MAKGKITEAQVRSFIKDFIEASKAGRIQKEERIKRLEETVVDHQVQIYLNGWQIQANSALSAAQMPPDDDSKVFWFIALGGNLIWAAASLNPEAIGANIALSFVGSAIGSGSLEQIYKNASFGESLSVDDAKQMAAGWIIDKRDQLEKEFGKSRRRWAEVLAGLESWESVGPNTDSIVDQFHARIWSMMFSRIPYSDTKYKIVFQGCLKNINAMLADFKSQWQRYVRMAAWFGEAERKKRGIFFQYRPSFVFDLQGTGELVPAPKFDDLKFH